MTTQKDMQWARAQGVGTADTKNPDSPLRLPKSLEDVETSRRVAMAERMYYETLGIPVPGTPQKGETPSGPPAAPKEDLASTIVNTAFKTQQDMLQSENLARREADKAKDVATKQDWDQQAATLKEEREKLLKAPSATQDLLGLTTVLRDVFTVFRDFKAEMKLEMANQPPATAPPAIDGPTHVALKNIDITLEKMREDHDLRIQELQDNRQAREQKAAQEQVRWQQEFDLKRSDAIDGHRSRERSIAVLEDLGGAAKDGIFAKRGGGVAAEPEEPQPRRREMVPKKFRCGECGAEVEVDPPGTPVVTCACGQVYDLGPVESQEA